jgi:hypothetical protein
LKIEIVARASPAKIKMIGKMVSIVRVFLSLICIRNLFFIIYQKWRKNTLVSASSEIV